MAVTTTAERADDAALPQDQNLLAALNVACAIIRDTDGTIRLWSAGAERLYGWPRQQAVGRRSHDLLATQFPLPLDTIQATLLADGEWHGELHHTARDGRSLYVASHWAVQRGPDGRPTGVVEINSDISFLQRAIAATRRLAAIVESSNDAIIGKTLDGIVTAWNQAAETMFGWSADEIVGRPIVLLYPPDRIAEEASIIERVRRGEKVARYATVRCRKDGTLVPVALTASPIRDSSGAIVGASTIIQDLSEQREGERRLQETQSELFHVQRLTELGQLVSALVHEVNQPLAAIGNYAGAGRRLLGTGQTAGANVALQKIAEQTERAHQIVQRLRGFVKKGESGRRTESLSGMVQEAVALASMNLSRQPPEIEIRIAAAADSVVADRIQVQQVLFNLLRNAIEAMAGTPRRSIVIAAAVDGAGMVAGAGMVEVAVADTGHGLSPAVRANLFRPFTTTKDNGMGVGLSVCRSIVEAHGGRLWAEDNPGGGTVFRFTLPRPVDPVTQS